MKITSSARPIAVAIMIAVMAMSACSTTVPSNGGSTAPVPAGAGHTGSGPAVASGHGWTTAGLDGPAYSSQTCQSTSATFKGQAQPLPDPHCTPGAIDPSVTQANLSQTVCRAGGYTKGVRPPYSLTEPAKRLALGAYGIKDNGYMVYEFDHLVPLELGGASDTRNLWPERNVGGTGGYVHNAKDQVENDLHAAVCSGHAPLVVAQDAVAANWTTAESLLGVTFGSGA